MLNLFLVWALTGFWHGASWNFIGWGLYYFVLILAEKLFLGKALEQAPKFVGHFYTLLRPKAMYRSRMVRETGRHATMAKT